METATQGLETLVVSQREEIFRNEDIQRAIATCAKRGVGNSPVSRLKYLRFVAQNTLRRRRDVHADARINYFEAKARSYIGKTYVPINPLIRSVGKAIASFLIKGSFSDLEVTGLDQLVDVPGKGEIELSQLLAEGGVGVVATHRMYFDIPNVVHVSGEQGIENLYYLGGNNVPQLKGGSLVKALKFMLVPAAKIWEGLFRNSGAILFSRKLAPKGFLGRAKGALKQAVYGPEEKLLLPNIDQAIVAYFLDEKRGEKRANVLTFTGNKDQNGRHRDARIPKLDSPFTKPLLEHADWIVPYVGIADIIPEAKAFAVKHEKSGQTIDGYLRKYTRLDHRYGKIRMHFCQPLKTSDFATKLSLEKEVTRSLIANTPLIPTSALAAALKLYDVESFSTSQITSLVEKVVDAAGRRGVRIVGELQDKASLQTTLYTAAMALTRQGMLKVEATGFKLHEPKLRDFYANMAIQTLTAAGVVNVVSVNPKADNLPEIAYRLVPTTTR